MTFYDLRGKPLAYIDNDGINIFLFNGKPVAYLSANAIYSYNGHQLGWFENGWIRDLNGYCVFYTDNANDSGPAKPMKRAKPSKRSRGAKPAKQKKHPKSAKAAKKVLWSKLSGEQFFSQ